MTEKRTFWLAHDQARQGASSFCLTAPLGTVVRFGPPARTLEQNSHFHAICGDIAKSGHPWAGKPRTAAQWKVLLVSGHAVATKEEVEIIPGLEGEFINIRESTALMSKRRGSSLLEYTIAFCVTNNIPMRDLGPEGFQ